MSRLGILIAAIAALLLGIYFFTFGWKSSYKVGSTPATTTTSNVDTENFSTWQEFTPSSGLFKVMLPHAPQFAKDLVDIPDSDMKRRYDMYASEKIDGTLFLISVITYPTEVDTSNSNDILKQIVDELMKSNPDNRLKKLQNSILRTHPALDFSINNGKFHVEGKVLMEGKIVYALSYISRVDDFDPVEYKHFIDSFELLGKQPEKDVPIDN